MYCIGRKEVAIDALLSNAILLLLPNQSCQVVVVLDPIESTVVVNDDCSCCLSSCAHINNSLIVQTTTIAFRSCSKSQSFVLFFMSTAQRTNNSIIVSRPVFVQS